MLIYQQAAQLIQAKHTQHNTKLFLDNQTIGKQLEKYNNQYSHKTIRLEEESAACYTT